MSRPELCEPSAAGTNIVLDEVGRFTRPSDPTPAKTNLERMLKVIRKFPRKVKAVQPPRTEYTSPPKTVTIIKQSRS
jgi:hypothetical protein